MSSNSLTNDELKQLVLDSFIAEKNNDINEGRECITEDFTVTEMTLGKDGNHFPSLTGEELDNLMNLAFKIEGREYEFKSIVADEKTQTVIVEFIESYPEPKTGQIYRTPQISVCKIKSGKIFRTRHYMDPRLSFENIDEETMNEVFNR